MKKEEKEATGDYYVRVKAIVNKMATLGEKTKEEDIIKKFLQTLTKMFDHAALIIEEIKDLSTMEIDNLISSLTSHEEIISKRTRVGASNGDE